ncbi:MAG: hypothetical protein OCD76_07215 [Reichenbachiella sp.]
MDRSGGDIVRGEDGRRALFYKSNNEEEECNCDQALALKEDNKRLRKHIRKLEFEIHKIGKWAIELGDE